MTSRSPLIIIGMSSLLVSLPLLAFAFSDVPSSHSHADAIVYMQENGIVQGYADGTFKPENQINRAEFTKIVIGAITQNPIGSDCFPDVKKEWFAPHVCTAKTMKIIGGYPDGTFGPTKTITFAEAAKIIANAFDVSEESGASNPWYKPFVMALGVNAAIPTDITDFSQPVTRGAMAEMIFRLRAKNTDKPSRTYEELAGEKLSSPSSRASSKSSSSLPISREGEQRKKDYIRTQLDQINANIDDFAYIQKGFKQNDLKEITPLFNEYKSYAEELASFLEDDMTSDEENKKAGIIIESANDVHTKMEPLLDVLQGKRCEKLESDYFYNQIYSSQEIMLNLSSQLCPADINRIQKCKSIAVQMAATYEGSLHMPEALAEAGCPANPDYVAP